MILDLLIRIHKDKLNKMIEQSEDYESILKQSQKLDIYITEKTIRIIQEKEKEAQKNSFI